MIVFIDNQRHYLYLLCCEALNSLSDCSITIVDGKELHDMKHKCSFCGCTYETFSFKQGYVCDGCLQYIKSACQPDTQVVDKE